MNRILFVDDSRNIREFCRQRLREEGYEVRVAADLPEAIQILEAGSVDLVITDFNLGRLGDGLALFRLIHAGRPELPVVLFTAATEELARKDVAGLAAVVSKSGDLAPLKATVARLLAGRGASFLCSL